jgi:hypothetical protein
MQRLSSFVTQQPNKTTLIIPRIISTGPFLICFSPAGKQRSKSKEGSEDTDNNERPLTENRTPIPAPVTPAADEIHTSVQEVISDAVVVEELNDYPLEEFWAAEVESLNATIAAVKKELQMV